MTGGIPCGSGDLMAFFSEDKVKEGALVFGEGTCGCECFAAAGEEGLSSRLQSNSSISSLSSVSVNF